MKLIYITLTLISFLFTFGFAFNTIVQTMNGINTNLSLLLVLKVALSACLTLDLVYITAICANKIDRRTKWKNQQ